MGLNDKSALFGDLLNLALLLLRGLNSLLLHHFLRDQDWTYSARFIGLVDLDFLVIAKNWLIDLLLQHLNLRIAQLLHRRQEFAISNLGRSLNRIASVLFSLVKHAKDSSLEGIDYKSVALLRRICSHQLNLSMYIHPSQRSVLVLLLEPGVEASHTAHHGRGNHTCWLVHGWPRSTG